MDPRWTQVKEIRRRRASERGAPFPVGRQRLALLYPGTYRVGMSSLGFQWIGHLLAEAGFGVERAFLPDKAAAGRCAQAIRSEESESPLGDFDLVAVSLAWELELADLVRALECSGIPAAREERNRFHPQILVGGPLSHSNPLPTAALADAMLLGEADETVVPAVRAFFEQDRAGWLDAVQGLPGGFVPERDPEPPPLARAAPALLPARARLRSPLAELSDMHLVEAERGCSRRCSFCVMRGGRAASMRIVPAERVLSSVPAEARRVGLVGAAVSDHPQLAAMLEQLIADGREVGVSSLRADRLAAQPQLAGLLRAGGLRTLTVAADAASQRLRDEIRKGLREDQLLNCAEQAAEQRFRSLKLYLMLGLPGEAAEDIDEFVQLARRMAGMHPLTVAVSPFVAKRGTPLAQAPFAGVRTLDRRLSRLSRGLEGCAELRSVSSRWAWVEWALAQGGPELGHAAVAAVRSGGGFGAWRKALTAAGARGG